MLLQPLTEGILVFHSRAGHAGHQVTDTGDLRWRRRLPRQPPTPRQHGSTHRAQDEVPAARPHSITSVTCSMISLGKVMPSACAVFILTTKSKVIGCSTGRS